MAMANVERTLARAHAGAICTRQLRLARRSAILSLAGDVDDNGISASLDRLALNILKSIQAISVGHYRLYEANPAAPLGEAEEAAGAWKRPCVTNAPRSLGSFWDLRRTLTPPCIVAAAETMFKYPRTLSKTNNCKGVPAPAKPPPSDSASRAAGPPREGRPFRRKKKWPSGVGGALGHWTIFLGKQYEFLHLMVNGW